MSWPVIDYVAEEVSRQGHDVSEVDGIERVGWMLNGWTYALHRAKWNAPAPTMEDAIRLGQLVEPMRNLEGLRRVDVYVRGPGGYKRFTPHDDVKRLLAKLFSVRDDMKPMEFYKEFEQVHPFVDGNGRTGKILLNWLNQSLLEPIFPPNDLFGEPIGNP